MKIDNFINGENYYICGNKGTGKTALLKYLECVLAKEYSTLIIPIRFKTQIDDINKKYMRNVANNIREDIIEDINVEKENSYIVIWQIYLINQIIDFTRNV